MAAHVITALNQLTEDIRLDRVNWDFIQAALNLSSWTEDLELDDYCNLLNLAENDHKSNTRLTLWINSVYEKYKLEWLKFDRPNTRENWNKLKYK